MPSDPPVVRVARMFQWECPVCGRWNHEQEFTLYDAVGKECNAKGKCVRCETDVELTL